jgi:asparagine synthase (glutamine-hydrolysing)
MCSFICSTKSLNVPQVNQLASKRGPDYTQTVKVDEFNIIHNLLDISRKKIIQPIVDENVILLFNGEIYDPKTTQDTLSIIPLYKEYGINFIDKVNGEYAIAIIDKIKNVILLYSDVFATKPLYYSVENKDIGFASYESDLKLLKFRNIKRVDTSTFIQINLNDLSVIEYKHSIFCLKEFKTSFDDCLNALENSFKLRLSTKNAVGISSGHDSGSILQWAADNKTQSAFYYVKTNKEDEEVVSFRKRLCESKGLQFKTIDYIEKYNLYNKFESALLASQMERFNYFKEEPSIFLLSKMMRYIKRDGINVFISGQGSDELLTNYFTKKKFYRDLKKQFPWRNFYGGTNRLYIDQLECVGGSYGIEVRYPFLDRVFVQEFLHLTKERKNYVYKSVLSEYLKMNKMPVKTEKVGLSLLKINS